MLMRGTAQAQPRRQIEDALDQLRAKLCDQRRRDRDHRARPDAVARQLPDTLRLVAEVAARAVVPARPNSRS